MPEPPARARRRLRDAGGWAAGGAIAALAVAVVLGLTGVGSSAPLADLARPSAPAPSSPVVDLSPTVRPSTTPAPPATVTADVAGARASIAYGALLRVFWDPRSRTFSAWSDGAEHDGHGPAADFWWAAQLWDVVIDEADRTRSPDALATVDAVYDGFLARHPTFVSDFNDDRGWWALAATRAYDLTDERRYLDRARSLLDGILASEDGSLGGGIWWRRSVHDQKNVATNAPAVMTASRLCTLTAERRDCDAAEALFSWLDRTLRDGSQVLDHVDSAGRRVDWSFSYNYGTFLAAALGAANAQPASDHGAAAKLRLLAGTVGDRAIAELSSDAVLRPDGDGDGGGFRGIFVRALASAAEELGRPDWSAFVAANADAVWRARRSDGLVGSSWVHPEGGLVESLTAASAVAVLEAAAIP